VTVQIRYRNLEGKRHEEDTDKCNIKIYLYSCFIYKTLQQTNSEHSVKQLNKVRKLKKKRKWYLPRDVMKCWWASTVLQFRLFFKSQTRSVLSSDADTAYFPLGWKTIPRTQLSWPIFNQQTPPTINGNQW